MTDRKDPKVDFHQKMRNYQMAKDKRMNQQLQEKEKEIEELKRQLEEAKSIKRMQGSKTQRENDWKRSSRVVYNPRASKSPAIREHLENQTFKPMINDASKRIVRSPDVCDSLYKEAKDRLSRQKCRLNTEISNTRKRANSRHSSNERLNSKFLVSKIMRNMNNACQSIGVLSNRSVNYQEMVKIMFTMGYILSNITEYEKFLIDNIFESIRDKNEESLRLKNLFYFILGVHEISAREKFQFNVDNEQTSEETDGEDSLINIQYSADKLENKMHPYGHFSDKGNFKFHSANEVHEVAKLFKVLIDNQKISAPWAYFGAISPEYEKEKNKELSFKPKINIIEQSFTNNKSSVIEEVLLEKGERYKEKAIDLREKIAQKEIEGCTFTPSTNLLKNTNVKSRLFVPGKYYCIKIS